MQKNRFLLLLVLLMTAATGAWANVTSTVQGDANGDGVVDVADIAAIVAVMNGDEDNDNADVNTDGTVNIADIAYVQNIMAQQSATNATGTAAITANAITAVNGGDNVDVVINLDYQTANNVVGASFTLYLPDGLLLKGFDTPEAQAAGKASVLKKACDLGEDGVWDDDVDNGWLTITKRSDGGLQFTLIDTDVMTPFESTQSKLITIQVHAVGDVQGQAYIKNVSLASEDYTSLDLGNLANTNFGVNEATASSEPAGSDEFPATYGSWTFDDGTTAGTGNATLAASDGVTFADGAATVPVNEMLSMTTNAGGDLTTYTFMMDVKVLNENSGRYTALFKTTLNDADLFIFNHKTNGRKIGINSNGMGFGGSINLNEWYRVVFSCTDAVATVYVDGVKVAAATSANTDKWTMHDVAYFFADNDGEENEISCDKICFWNVALTDAQAALLGGVGTEIPGEATAPATYTVTLNDGTQNPNTWTGKAGDASDFSALPLTGLKESQAVTLQYNGRLKVKAVTATTDAAPADPLATPLTVEAITAGTIVVKIDGTLSTGMKYSVNGGTKTTIYNTTNIEGLKAGDKVQFYGNGTQTQDYGNNIEVKIQGNGDGFQTKMYGNIMSLLDENDFATKTDLPSADNVFYQLFQDNITLIDASELLLPAKKLTKGCYYYMFYDCSNLTTAPKLPATTLARGCYYNMFQNCNSLTSAHVKAAYTDANYECTNMFKNCTATGAVLHTTSDNKASWETMMGTGKTWSTWTVADDWQD